MRRTTVRGTVAVAVLAMLAIGGCSAHATRDAGVAPSFFEGTSPASPPAPPQSSPSAATAPSETLLPASVSDSATPCPPPAPQLFVEGKRAQVKDGQITLSYVDAQRLCSGGDDVRFVPTGNALTTKAVSPSATVLLLAPGAGSDELQVPPPALPAAMASDEEAPFFTITVDGTGAITRIEQSYHP